MFTYYVIARNEYEAMLQAARKHNAGEKSPWLSHVTTKDAWCVTFALCGLPSVCRVNDVLN